MILQFQIRNGDYYLEADLIGTYEVDISDFKEKEPEKILLHIEDTIPVCVGASILDVDCIFDNETLGKCNKLKIAVLSDAKEKKDNKVLMFSENSEVYILNNNGKTIKRL